MLVLGQDGAELARPVTFYRGIGFSFGPWVMVPMQWRGGTLPTPRCCIDHPVLLLQGGNSSGVLGVLGPHGSMDVQEMECVTSPCIPTGLLLD